MPTEVRSTTDEARGLTAVTVIAPDRPGLLALLGRIFLDHRLVLQKAKIATLGERVEDIFFVTDDAGQTSTG